MHHKNHIQMIPLLVMLFSLITAIDANWALAEAHTSLHLPQHPSETSKAQPEARATPAPTPAETGACHPGTGWVWTTGPEQPEAAQQAQLDLKQTGIDSRVTAFGFGEKDSCGSFKLFSTDFSITLAANSAPPLSAQSELANHILSALSQRAAPLLGNVQITFGPGNTKYYPNPARAQEIRPPAIVPASTEALLNKKVFLLVYDPILSNGQDINTYMGWTPYSTLVQNIIASFQTASHGQLQYSVTNSHVANEWPVKADGFRYTEATFLAAYNHHSPHQPDPVNYDVMIDDPRFDICGRLNRGEIDELWVYAGPYDGFYESRLVGPDAFWFNSPPMADTHHCSRLLPIMGLNYERGVAEAMESFGHRAESTMTKVYGSWQENRTAHNWDRFALDKAQSPAYSYSGCGNIHYPPNGVRDYDWYNPRTVLTNCEDFRNYPNLNEPLSVARPVTCSAWNCQYLNYLMYWFGHLPSYPGFGPDAMANDWWQYFADPAKVFYYFQATCPTITHWKGEYWNNSTMTGNPRLCRDEASVRFDWELGPPDPLIPAESFSARWTRTLFFAAKTYHFSIRHDDGARLLIDDQIVIDNWYTCCTTDVADVPLASGDHVIRMEMNETGGIAYAELSWTNPPGVPVLVAPANNRLITNYQPKLDWNDSTLPDETNFAYYQVQVAKATTFASPILDIQQPGLTSSEYTLTTNLEPARTYFWRARAFNTDEEASDWSSTASFRTAILPPTLASPANGATLPKRRPLLDWYDVSGANGYTVNISMNSNFNGTLVTAAPKASAFTPSTNLPTNIKLYWRVQVSGNDYGPSAWSETGSFDIGNSPGIPTLLAPRNKALTTNYRPKLDWKSSSVPAGTGFDHYQVQVATSSSFSPTLLDEQRAGLTFSDFTPANDLAPNTIYYWRVRAFNTAGQYSDWSSTLSFRTAILPPTLALPGEGARLPERLPALDWDDVNGASGYVVQISRYANFRSLVSAGAPTISTFTPYSNLPANTKLYWRVQARGINGPSVWSAARSFTTGNPPGIPALLAPRNKALTTNFRPKLDWKSSSVPAGTGFDHYQVQVATSSSFSPTLLDEQQAGLTSSDFTPASDLAPNTIYYWRVKAFNTAGEYSGWSNIGNFRTAILPPTLVLPTDGATALERRPAFDWDDVAGASRYYVQISRYANFRSLVSAGAPTISTFTPYSNLPANTKLYWRVQARGINGPSAWSAARSFTTTAPGAAVDELKPKAAGLNWRPAARIHPEGYEASVTRKDQHSVWGRDYI